MTLRGEARETFRRIREACCEFHGADVDLDDHAAKITETVLNARRKQRRVSEPTRELTRIGGTG